MNRIRLRIVLSIAFLVASSGVSSVCAAPYWINSGTGDWMDAGNWSLSAPSWGDDVLISNGGTAYVDADVTSAYWIGSLTLGEGFGQLGNLELRPGASLGVLGPVLVGLEGMGGVYQQGGRLQTDSALSVGVAPYGVGGYDLASGQVSAYSLYVGEMGLGQFDHRGGSVLVGPDGLQIGSQYQGHGTYNLSGVSQLAVEGDLSVGHSGNGTFHQHGGVVVLSPYSLLHVGRNQDSVGSYQMVSGILSAPLIVVGNEGNGSFAQDNGSVDTLEVVLGGAPWGRGTYQINGGRLDVQNEMVVGQFGAGTFTHGGGLVNIFGGGGGPAMMWLAREAGSVGRYEMNSTTGQLSVQGVIVVGSEGNGEFVQSAGDVSAHFLDMGTSHMDGPSFGSGTYQMSGGRLDLAQGMGVGIYSVGCFEQTGGTVNVGDALFLGYDYDSQGTYTISAGSLRTRQIAFGNGDGRMTISGMADVTIEMSGYNPGIFGNNTGMLLVDGGSLTNYGEIVGVNTFILGSAAGTDGSYTSHYYTEIVENFVVGDAGRGQYVQAAGQTYGPSGSPDAALIVGNQATGDGTVRVEGGDFHFNKMQVGNHGVGTYKQTGSSGWTDGGEIVLGVEASGQGTLAVRDGQFRVYNLLAGQRGSGTVVHDGGEVRTYGSLVLGAVSGGEGTYNLTGPQPGGTTQPARLFAQGMLVVGEFGSGAFNQGGGNSVASVNYATVVGAAPGSQGTYRLNGWDASLPEVLLTTGYLDVGSYGSGLFEHQGTESTRVRVLNNMYLGGAPGSDGVYEMTITPLLGWAPGYVNLDVDGTLYVGHGGTGTVVQQGGVAEIGRLILGHESSGDGTLTLQDGELLTGLVTVGGRQSPNMGIPAGRGTIIQNGGLFNANGPIYMAAETESHGAFILNDGETRAFFLSVGNQGNAEFEQHGGMLWSRDGLSVAFRGRGSYTMTGGTIDASMLRVAAYGEGTFVQQGGSVKITGPVILGERQEYGVPGQGSYTITSGRLEADALLIGPGGGSGEFLQTGGDVMFYSMMRLGGSGPLSGNYTMTGGTLTTNEVHIPHGRELTISNGSVAATGRVYFGQASGEEGQVTVAGGSNWSVMSQPLYVAEAGTATLGISGGSTVMVEGGAPVHLATEPTGIAHLTVDGSASRLAGGPIRMAEGGTAHVNVTDGGSIRAGWNGTSWTTAPMVIAHLSGSRAEIVVGGPGSEIAAGGDLWVGYGGFANLTISRGGSVSSGNLLNATPGGFVIAVESSSDVAVTVDGSGSEIVAGDWLDVASSGRATLQVTGGGQVSAGRHGTTNPGVIRMAIAPDAVANVLVSGPGSRMEADIAYIGGGTNQSGGTANVELRDAAVLAAGELNIWPGGSVLVDRSIVEGGDLNVMSGSVRINDGTVHLTSGAILYPDSTVVLQNAGRLSARSVGVSGTLRGDGMVGGSLTVNNDGTVRAGAGEYLAFTGAPAGGPPAANAGLVAVVGGTMDFLDPVLNTPDGTISGHGLLVFQDGLTNHGAMNFSGDVDIFGPVVNGYSSTPSPYGEVVVSGTATATFHDKVVHNGPQFRVSDEAHAVFFGPVSGAGSFTGGGGIYFEAGYSPGNSPAWIDSTVDMTFGPQSVSTFELAGYSDAEYDVVNLIDGATLALGGMLNVELLDGFEPSLNAYFDLFRFESGHLAGTFDEVTLAPWLVAQNAFVVYGDTFVRLQIIPEPSSFLLLAFGSLALAGIVGRRKRRR